MPASVRKLSIIATTDGLLLRPAHQHQQSSPTIQLKYSTHEIVRVGDNQKILESTAASLECYGVIGLFTAASSSHIIVISNRRQVAQIKRKIIYTITGVAIIPLSSQKDARRAIEGVKAAEKQAKSGQTQQEDDSSDEDERRTSQQCGDVTDNDESAVPTRSSSKVDFQSDAAPQQESTVAKDVIDRKGQYGRFAERWFSRQGWSVEKKRMQGMSGDEVKADISDDQYGRSGVEGRPPQVKGEIAALVPKLLKTTKMLLSSESFFFSYEYDITRRFGSRGISGHEIPLYKLVDPLYFWNSHLMDPFLAAGQGTFVLPIMQGFVGQRAFTVDADSQDPKSVIAAVNEDVGGIVEMQKNAAEQKTPKDSPHKEYLITLISRRSIKRPGLRYLRRGVDAEGNTANSVETEQILSSAAWSPTSRIHSFSQLRGSIPLYFSQSPYSFKPAAVLQHSDESNHAAFKHHFNQVINTYGGVQIALLVDKHGGEAKVGEEYEKHTKQFNDENGIKGTKLGFEWFDFHAVCRGMKFENVSLLIDSLDTKLEEFGHTIEKHGIVQSKQVGVLRTNCMDCLDRTNVVQSACGQRALEHQLKREGITLSLQADATTQWFNTLWADNGDAISKQYSSTAALKGDYTRTRKRDYRGAINDFGLTLSRYFNNIVNDYFSQAAIDFLLGNVTDQVFEEFESDMMSGDPAMSMAKLRQTAIDTSSKIVIADQSEELSSGMTLLSPHEPNTVRTFPFEECVLLLTDAALYAVRFDWNMEKVSSFEKVDLRSITGIMKGTYITSTLAAAQTDEKRNVGFVVKYRPGKEDIKRVNTRSLSTAVTPNPGKSNTEQINEEGRRGSDDKATDSDSDDRDVEPTPQAQETTCDLEDQTSSHPNSKSSSVADLKILSFKALTTRSSHAGPAAVKESQEANLASEEEQIKNACEEIRKAVRRVAAKSKNERKSKGEGGGEGEGENENDIDDFIEERDIIGLAEAKKRAGYLEQWTHGLKKLVWA